MSQFPTDSEVRECLWQWFTQKTKGSQRANFRLHEIQEGVVYALTVRGYINSHINGNISWRLPQFIMELVTQAALSPNSHNGKIDWSEFCLTEHGRTALASVSATCYDPDGYITLLRNQSEKIDNVIVQYMAESIACFRRGILFACAVMLGAAAEKAILLLLDSIIESKQDVNKQGELRKLYANQNLPRIFELIQKTLEPLTAKNGGMDYSIHQGSSQHLLSLFEMIRVQRNESVHPTSPANGTVDSVKLMLSLNSFPTALGVIYKLSEWFSARKGTL